MHNVMQIRLKNDKIMKWLMLKKKWKMRHKCYKDVRLEFEL